MSDELFPFGYRDQTYEATAIALPNANGFRRFKINFPNVQSIVEGSVYLNETPEAEWEICKIIGADPVHEEFLHAVSQGFVEYIDTQNVAPQ